MIYSCCNLNRKSAVLNNPTLNGIDYLEVLDNEVVTLGLDLPRQQTLLVHCLKPLPDPLTITTDNVLITGGESITGITAAWVAVATAPPSTLNAQTQAYFTNLPDAPNVLIVGTSAAGDFSTYTFRLVNDAATALQDPFTLTAALTGFDPHLTTVQFSFKVECGPDFDCNPQSPDCPPDLPAPPPINYLAKDYGSFRTIMLDRLNQLLPSWGATSEADFGIALAEVIAYVGDRLSYQQDAIATEAYINTARSRISLRRHALLVDYHVHDGCNARAWVQVQVQGNPGQQIFLDRTLTNFYTKVPGPIPGALFTLTANDQEAALIAGVQVFEPMCDAVLYPENAQMNFYTWGNFNCCLPEGATEATLQGTYPNLQPGDVLIFQEMKGPQTGEIADADLRHRCAVRLTQVATQDASGNTLVDPLFDKNGKPITGSGQTPMPITEIQWSTDDALPFPVCISSTYLDANSDEQTVTDVSVAFGNIVLADHGLSFTGTSLGTVPSPTIYYPPNTADRCNPTQPTPVPVRYQPQIPDSPLTQAVPVSVVSLPGTGNPVTSGALSLSGGYVALPDASGFISLTLEVTNPAAWPSLFGVVVAKNTSNPANIDLSVVYNPPGGAAGFEKKITVESFADLSLNSADPSYVVTQVNANSQLIQVQAPSSAATPAGFPASPTMLSNTGPVNLQDLSTPPVTYLTAQPTNTASWPSFFGVIAAPNANPAYFDLQLIYQPSGGSPTVTVEEFTNLSPATAAQAVDAGSSLVTVESFAQAVDPSLSAYDLMNYDADDAVPEITLAGTLNGVTQTWTPLQNLLSSGESDPVFVVEVEYTGVASLRFGDNTNGKTPDAGTSFTANYRIGNGTAGNVGADSLIMLEAADPRITGCRNPLPASGGIDPETNDQIRRRAPQQFLTQERAVTMADYEAAAELNTQVEQAVASTRWTGSWYTVFIAVEPQNGGSLTSALQKSVQSKVNSYRLAGEDLQLDSPQYVSLEIELQICVDPTYFNLDVRSALQQVLGSQILPNGQKGFFYPGNFTFGQSVYLSPIYAAVRAVPGVNAVTAIKFQIQGVDTDQYLESGEILLGSLQVARLENDPSYPDHGQLTLDMEGGK